MTRLTVQDFEREITRIVELVDLAAELPEQVFRAKPCAFRVVDFSAIWSAEFFLFLQQLTTAVDSTGFILAVLRPDPSRYFYRHFNRYPLLRFSINDASECYIEEVNEDPGGSPADSIITNSTTLIIYPESRRWAIYGDRDLDVAIIAAMDDVAVQYILSHARHQLYSADAAVPALLARVYHGEVPAAIAEALVHNYRTA
jgi:hypothetical protein